MYGPHIPIEYVVKVEEWLFAIKENLFLRLSIARIPTNPERILVLRARLVKKEIPYL